jgi:arginyl-tRNA synthetase
MPSAFELFRRQCAALAGRYANLLEKPRAGQADLCLPCYRIAKGKNPVNVAQKLAKKLNEKNSKKSMIARIEATGPYVNFFVGPRFTFTVIKEILSSGERYGSQPKKKERIILEHTSFNPSGPVHIGRLRNSVIGDCLARILRFAGWPVKVHYYVNDVGKQIAIIAWGKKNKIKPANWLVEEYSRWTDRSDFQTMFEYVSANSALEANPERNSEVEEMLQRCEQGEQELTELKNISKNCLKGQLIPLAALGITFDVFVPESRFIENGSVARILKKLKSKGLLIHINGALGVDLSRYGLRERVVLARANGSSVYLLRDIAYHLEKAKSADRIINVLGEDHKLEALELRTILKNFLNFKKPIDVVHYAFVNFKGLRLSTRKGQIASVDELLEEGTSAALEQMKARGEPESIERARAIAAACIRYHLIRTSPEKTITFVWEDVLNFEGNSGAYLQYTLARALNILENAKLRKKKPQLNANQLKHELESAIVKQLATFPEVINRCVKELKPYYLADALYKLASTFNAYYQSVRVLDSPEERSRLALVAAVVTVLKNGLNLLGIPTLKRM